MSRAWPVDRLDPRASTEVAARRILQIRIAEFFSREGIVEDPTATEELHDLRISAKRLRYTLELFADTLGEEAIAAIARVKTLQERLGDLHDADVRIALVADELEALAAEQIRDLVVALAGADPEWRRALVATAVRPPNDDPRRGLIDLLAREIGRRELAYDRFLDAWRGAISDGLRTRLDRLAAS